MTQFKVEREQARLADLQTEKSEVQAEIGQLRTDKAEAEKAACYPHCHFTDLGQRFITGFWRQ